MNLYLKLSILSVVLLHNCSAWSQTDTAFLNRATTSLEKHASASPIEKVYLHLDKNNYDLGDTIWYKAYTVVGQNHKLSALSGVLYVELISPADTVMSRQILHLASGLAWGGLALPDKAKPGDYHIRAYTNWMRNAGAEYFYNQKIRIGGYEIATANKPATHSNANPDVQFFPEGGWLVNDLRSKVAVKAVNANGYGQDIKGTIEDNLGNVIVDFATRHLGMGAFAFTPQSGRTYKAKIITGESSFTVDLPLAKQEGYILGINNSSADSIFIKVAANEVLFKQKQHATFFITAQNSGKVYYAATGKLEDMVFTASVDKKRFPSGITQFTLFSESGEPLNERAVFIQSNDTLALRVNNNKTSAIRQKVKLELDAKDKENKAITGAFSVAVINESIVTNDEAAEGSIINNLLLTSDLKGYIEQPNYYFINPNEQTKADLDVLMLTQGYSRFEWKPILADTQAPPIYQPETALELAGTLNTPSGKPVPGGKVILIAPHEKFLTDTITDANGNFRFTELELPDSARLTMSAQKVNKGSNVEIKITPPTYPLVVKQNITDGLNKVPELSPPPIAVTSADTVAYQKQKAEFLKGKRQLREVNIKAKKVFKREGPDVSGSANLNGPGHADQVFTAADLKDAATLYDSMVGRVKNVDMYIGAMGVVTALNRRVHGMHARATMIVVIDGNISPGTNLNDINPNIVHSIEVLTSPQNLMIYGYDVGGAFLITTKHAGDKDFYDTAPAPGTLKYTFNGFYKVKEFYSPKYDAPKTTAHMPDLRSTVYWNPNIITDKDGKVFVEYFNSDGKGIYRVVIEGIDSDGNLGRVVSRYKVD